MKRSLAIIAAALLATFTVAAQDVFTPAWYLGVQGGVSYTTSNEWGYAGWDKLKHLNFPNLEFDYGYEFTPAFTLRGALSGPIGNFPGPEHMSIHRFGYLQLAADAKFDICNAFRYVEERPVSPYLFLGAGLNYRFPVEGKAGYFGPVIRGGAGLEVRLTDLMDLTFEFQHNALNNKFNTLTEADKGPDWDNDYHGDDGLYYGGEILHIEKPFRWDDNLAALVGLKFNIGKAKKRAAAAAAALEAAAAGEAAAIAAADRAIARAVEEKIFFALNSAEIRESEQPKVEHLIEVLKTFPEAVINISGYADKDTGNPEINLSLSAKRCAAVAKALTDAGIAAERITTDPQGDTVRVSEVPEENRVCVCITK